jgi:hypothetical protein
MVDMLISRKTAFGLIIPNWSANAVGTVALYVRSCNLIYHSTGKT